MDMDGKVVLVTGANRGIGRGLTEALAERGATVLMVCRDEHAGSQVEDDLRGRDLDVSLYVADMSSIADIEWLYDDVSEEFEVLDVLINNAAVNLDGEETTIEEMPLEIIETTMAINFFGPFWMCRKFIPMLKNSESGRIINFTSGLGRLTIPRTGAYPAYSISKVAINGLTKLLATELASTDVIVNSVDPGWVRTRMGGEQAPLALEEGVDTPLWLATASADELESGCLYHNRHVVSW